MFDDKALHEMQCYTLDSYYDQHFTRNHQPLEGKHGLEKGPKLHALLFQTLQHPEAIPADCDLLPLIGEMMRTDSWTMTWHKDKDAYPVLTVNGKDMSLEEQNTVIINCYHTYLTLNKDAVKQERENRTILGGMWLFDTMTVTNTFSKTPEQEASVHRFLWQQMDTWGGDQLDTEKGWQNNAHIACEHMRIAGLNAKKPYVEPDVYYHEKTGVFIVQQYGDALILHCSNNVVKDAAFYDFSFKNLKDVTNLCNQDAAPSDVAKLFNLGRNEIEKFQTQQPNKVEVFPA